MDFYADKFREKINSFANLDCVQCEHKEELCANVNYFGTIKHFIS